MNGRVRAAGLALAVVACQAQAQVDQHPVRWTAAGGRTAIHAGDTTRVVMRAAIAEFFHLYSTTQPAGGPIRTTVSMVPGSVFALHGRVRAPAPDSIPDANFGIMSEVYSDSVTFGLTLRAGTALPAGRSTALARVRYQACTARYCLPPRTDTVGFAFLVTPRTVR